MGGAIEPDAFGRALSYGDFDGDSFADLVVSDPGVSEERFGQGGVTVLYGSPNSLSLVRAQNWSLDSPGIRGRAAEGDGFGDAVASGDFDGDDRDDLAIGVPGRGGSGLVLVLYGQRDGLSARSAQTWSRKSAGLQGGLTTDADFGRSLVAGDFDGDHRDELAVGAPYNTVDGHEGAGSLYVLRGGDDGLTSGGFSSGRLVVAGSRGSRPRAAASARSSLSARSPATVTSIWPWAAPHGPPLTRAEQGRSMCCTARIGG